MTSPVPVPVMTGWTATATTTYEVRVVGHLDDHWATWLDDLTLTRHDDGTTVLTGPIGDQSELHGLLARIRDLGAPLLALRTLNIPSAVLRHPVVTERLTLRPGSEHDADATWTYRRLASVGEWLTELPPDVNSYRSSFAEPGRLAATVIVELDGLVIGDLMLRVGDAWAQAEVTEQAKRTMGELGWVLDPAHTGHGYATEAVRALVDYCFTDLGLRRVVASCFLADDASARLMERVGMRREGHAVAESLHRSGRWLDTVTYGLLAGDWP